MNTWTLLTVQVIRAVQPDVVMVELCKSRINILELDEEMLLEEAKNINLEKFRFAIKQVLYSVSLEQVELAVKKVENCVWLLNR